MSMMQMIGINVAAVLSFSLVLLAPGTSSADRQAGAGEILLLSDEILGNSVEIERAAFDAPPFNGVPGATAPDDPAPALAGGGDPGDGEDDEGSTLASGPDHGPVGENSRSGFGDGSNPGMGSGTANSPNEGTDSPNNAPDRSHPSLR